MTRITMQLEGGDQLAAALRAYGAAAEKHVGDAVNATGLELRADIVKAYQRGPKSGRVYTHYFFTDGNGNLRQGRKRDKPHQASAPDEAPATDTGNLASRIDFKREGATSATVGSQVVYASMLEFGTSRIAPRPAWVPATEAMRPKFRQRLEAALARAAK